MAVHLTGGDIAKSSSNIHQIYCSSSGVVKQKDQTTEGNFPGTPQLTLVRLTPELGMVETPPADCVTSRGGAGYLLLPAPRAVRVPLAEALPGG
jgi:hypothetical protein